MAFNLHLAFRHFFVLTLEEARQFYPAESGMSDEQLMQLVQAIDHFQDRLLGDYFGFNESEQGVYF